jgi:hypothetical protein
MILINITRSIKIKVKNLKVSLRITKMEEAESRKERNPKSLLMHPLIYHRKRKRSRDSSSRRGWLVGQLFIHKYVRFILSLITLCRSELLFDWPPERD